jgi:hypothetical protein
MDIFALPIVGNEMRGAEMQLTGIDAHGIDGHGWRLL